MERGKAGNACRLRATLAPIRRGRLGARSAAATRGAATLPAFSHVLESH